MSNKCFLLAGAIAIIGAIEVIRRVKRILPQSGDSGGIIYDKNTKRVCGELFGRGTMSGANYMLFSSAELALNALGAKLY